MQEPLELDAPFRHVLGEAVRGSDGGDAIAPQGLQEDFFELLLKLL